MSSHHLKPNRKVVKDVVKLLKDKGAVATSDNATELSAKEFSNNQRFMFMLSIANNSPNGFLEFEAVKNIETYGNMYDCVMPYKVLSEIDLQKNELFNTKARATILGNKNLLFQEIKDEWYAIGCNDETTEEVHCQLCGRKNKRIFYIKNRKNNNELHVGSACIKKFPDIENISVIRKTMRTRDEFNFRR